MACLLPDLRTFLDNMRCEWSGEQLYLSYVLCYMLLDLRRKLTMFHALCRSGTFDSENLDIPSGKKWTDELPQSQSCVFSVVACFLFVWHRHRNWSDDTATQVNLWGWQVTHAASLFLLWSSEAESKSLWKFWKWKFWRYSYFTWEISFTRQCSMHNLCAHSGNLTAQDLTQPSNMNRSQSAPQSSHTSSSSEGSNNAYMVSPWIGIWDLLGHQSVYATEPDKQVNDDLLMSLHAILTIYSLSCRASAPF